MRHLDGMCDSEPIHEGGRQAALTVLKDREATLTAREREVLALVVRGRMNKHIATELGITEITVKLHRRSIMDKMGAPSLAELVRMTERIL